MTNTENPTALREQAEKWHGVAGRAAATSIAHGHTIEGRIWAARAQAAYASYEELKAKAERIEDLRSRVTPEMAARIAARRAEARNR